VVGYAALIFYLSSLPNPEEKIPLPDISDKWLHVLEYAVLGWLCFRAFRWAAPDRPAHWAFIAAVVASSLYGLSDEIHQAFVPLRESSWLDSVADAIGSLIGAGLAMWILMHAWARLLAARREGRPTP
jgi:VanZ family protein